MDGDTPEIDLDEEMTLEDFVSQVFPGYEIESVVMPVTGERIAYANGEEQPQSAVTVLQPGSGDIQGARAATRGDSPEAE